ncbi:hypothetical protein WJX72_011558 [[Myrmecia] bisecta]|uniref:Rieske domain-containing protein n=1 Tax=[Myrmecia] bisecta TaxID=41462 RepID=A0AAW1QTL5_9CHLO
MSVRGLTWSRAALTGCRSQHQVLGRLPPVLGLPRLRQRRCRQLTVHAQPEGQDQPSVKTLAAREVDDDPSPFFEPLLRSFLLGLGAGAIFESLHVAMKFFGVLDQVGYSQLAEVWPKVLDQVSPLFVGDHVVAVASWIVFYVIEAVAIMAVLNRPDDNPTEKKQELHDLVTLPKKMLPMRLALFKHVLLRGSGTLKPAAATATLERPATLPRTFPPLLPGNTAGGSRGRVESSIVAAPPSLAPSKPRTLPKAPKPSPAPQPPPPQEDSQVTDVTQSLQKERQKKGLKPGQWDPDSSMLAHRMKELTGRRSYLKNFWYAAAISEKVGKEPVGVEIMGEKVVLYRGKDGTVHCVSDVCPHRGAPLHRGWVTEIQGHDCVVCPYHGWAFDEGGVLRDVPAAENAKEWPEKPLIDTYPVQEKGGFVWMFYGSRQLPADERPPIPYVPELEDPAWKPVYGEIEFECNHWSVFENAIDMAHIHYLHDDTFGNQGQPQIRGMTCTHDAYGVKAQFHLHNKPVNALWEFSKVPAVHVTAQALLGSTSVIAFTLGNGLSFTTFVNTVPINGNRTVNRFALVRNLSIDKTGIFNMNAWDGMARKAMLRILSEDKAMVEELRPDLLAREISVKADLPQIAFRKLRQEYIDMGYGVLPEEAHHKFRSDF